MHTGGPTWSWSSSARPDACFRSTKEKRTLAASAKQGRNREDPRNKRFRQLLGTSPQIPLSGPASHGQSGSSSQPPRRVVMAAALLGRPQKPDIARVQQPRVGSQKLSAKVGPAACRAKANKEARLVERKVCFISEAGNLAGWGGGTRV